MDVILKQDVPNLGHKDDIITVKNGYATELSYSKRTCR